MQEEVLRPNRMISCNAGYYYNGRRYGCHAHPSAQGVEMALKHSCNAYYFTVVRDIVEKYGFKNPQRGLDSLVEHAHDFGIGVKLGVDVPNEQAGICQPPVIIIKYIKTHHGTLLISCRLESGRVRYK